MRIPKIKICGIRREEDIAFVNAALPEYIGFVFAKGRRRYIEPEKALSLKKTLDKRISAAGVFVDEEPDTIEKIAASGAIDMIQLHGAEDEEYIRRIRNACALPVIKAFTVRSEDDLKRAMQSTADFILLDNGEGTGAAFDHSLLRNAERDYFLAGGLSCGNIEEIIEEYSPAAVDVSSGVETNGVKDAEKIYGFIRTVRKEG